MNRDLAKSVTSMRFDARLALAGLVAAAASAGCVEEEAFEEPRETPLENPGGVPAGTPGTPESSPEPAAPGFELVFAGDTVVVQGASARHEIGVISTGGFAGAVSLSATSAYPLGLAFNPSTVISPGRSELTITAPCDWPAVMRQVQITGAAGTTTRLASLTVRVFPFGSFVAERASVHVPRAIPDSSVNGAASTLFFSEPELIQHMVVTPRITHPRPADLVIDLISPGGAIANLHNHAATLQPSYTVFAYNLGYALVGGWKLRVIDSVTGSVGTIDGWSMRAMVRGLPPPPSASFSASVNQLAVNFTDTSTDPQACGGNGEVVSWSWSFGDGTTSTARHPQHTYAAPGLYEVTLTVTNGSDIPAVGMQRVTVGTVVRGE